MKRIFGIVLMLALLITTFAALPVFAASEMTVSDDLVRILKMEEGFVRYPQWDYGQYSIGYGTRCPDDMLEYYKENGITESEAELLLRNYLTNTEKVVNTKLIDKYGLTMTQGQFDAVVSFSYNMGSGWITNPSQNIHQKVVSGATGNELIDAFSRWCNAGGEVQHFLVRRRLSEANMYLNGVYSRTAPGNFCYVTYNGNGGTTSQSAQGYDSDLTAKPVATASYGSYTFTGWYTAQVGGTKVETLTSVYNGDTLYAHWAELENITEEDSKDPISVKVTTDGVNLRKGPGTNYAVIGLADIGEKFEILQVRESGGYLWGQYDGGWICLQYTNYDKVISGEPEATEPPATEPTTPQPTEPKPTTPPTTVPPVTTPPVTNHKTGTVNANPYLCVRQGPGTGYATVDTLRTGEKVTITEQKTVGSMVWGKIAGGWISMSYVVLDKVEEPEVDTEVTTPTGKTGTVTCSMLNVRSGAGINYGIVGYYYKGNTVTVTEQKTVGSTTWGKTAKGWVSMDYIALKTEQGSSGTQGSTPSTAVTGTVTSSDVLRVRKGAGTSYAIVGFLNPGSKVTITEQKTVGATVWGKISNGWISMDYIKLDNAQSGNGGTSGNTGTTAPQSVTRTVNVSCLIIRSGAGTSNSIVGYLYRGAKVTVTEQKTVGSMLWGKISNGWICLDYTK